MTTRAREVAVWYCLTDSLAVMEIAILDAWLSAEERQRRDRLLHEADRRDFTVAHGLLRLALSTAGDRSPDAWRFVRGPYGKPAVVDEQGDGPPLRCSLTHARGLVACAVTRHTETGIDAERGHRISGESTAAAFFSAVEQVQLAACPDNERPGAFLDFWTLKEAYLKCVGQGLSLPLDSFAFTFEGPTRLTFSGRRASGNSCWRPRPATQGSRWPCPASAKPPPGASDRTAPRKRGGSLFAGAEGARHT